MVTRATLAACLYLAPACAAAAGEIHVLPGQSIQAAVDRARPGDRIVVFPGVYHEVGRNCPNEPSKVCAVVVSTDHISLVAAPRLGHPVVLANAGGQDTGIAVARQGAAGAQCLSDRHQRVQGASVEGFTVTGFGGSGILLLCVDGWNVSGNTASDNFEYGIFPSHCGPGTVLNNVATGAHDTGIYVGVSHDVLVAFNVAHGNVSGFEVENSVRVLLHRNESFANTVGILVFVLPGRDVLASSNNVLDANLVHDNNAPNTCPPGDDVCAVPPGSGILIVGGTRNFAVANQVHGNHTTGIALLDVCNALQLSPSDCASLGFDPLPESSRIEFNTLVDNGANPQESLYPGADLFWTGVGTGNCWKKNVASVVIPPNLPACR